MLLFGGTMAEKWFDDMPDDTFFPESERIYKEALAKVRAGLAKGFDFETASATVDIKDKNLRETVLDDVLKVFIAEEHFAKNVPLEQISQNLHLPIERIEKARKEMFEDVENSAVDIFYKNREHGTEH
jgi:glycosylphosphatidylinositol transamidase (GPIT) subunit GPI8